MVFIPGELHRPGMRGEKVHKRSSRLFRPGKSGITLPDMRGDVRSREKRHHALYMIRRGFPSREKRHHAAIHDEEGFLAPGPILSESYPGDLTNQGNTAREVAGIQCLPA
jgi:hypothetical protein